VFPTQVGKEMTRVLGKCWKWEFLLMPDLGVVQNLLFGYLCSKCTMPHIFGTMLHIFGTMSHIFGTMSYIFGTMPHAEDYLQFLMFFFQFFSFLFHPVFPVSSS
jgi:hypothetical protein